MKRWSDEQIVAYLDGKLDMAEGQALHRDRQQDAALDAYVRSMEIDVHELASAADEMLHNAPELPPLPSAHRAESNLSAVPGFAGSGKWRTAAIAASLIAVFVAGFLTSNLLSPGDKPPQNWVQAVAEYQMLYTGQTLLLIKKSPDEAAREVADIGRKMGLILARSDVDLDGLELKRSQLLKFKNKPLVQFAYLDKSGVPISFCIIKKAGKTDKVGSKPSPIKGRKMLAGQNAAVWSMGNYGFVVIGKKDTASINKIAEQLKTRMMEI